VKPSLSAARDCDALKSFLSIFESSVETLTGTSLGEEWGTGMDRTTVINVVVSTEGDHQRAERALMEAVGAADGAWVRWRGTDRDLERETRQVLHSRSSGDIRRLDLALRTAVGRAEMAHRIAVEREKSRLIQPLAWLARLPDEVAEVAGVDHERAGRTLGRVAQIALPGGTLSALGLLLWKLVS
jgi:hypothetical protein